MTIEVLESGSGVLPQYATIPSDEADVGRAALAWRMPELDMLDGRDDVAVLWDLRVHPSHQRRGIESALLHAVGRWARSQGVGVLKVETQDVNAPACRFDQAHGCVLAAHHRQAYSVLPREVQLLWYVAIRSTSERVHVALVVLLAGFITVL